MTNITKAAQDALAALDEIHAGKRHPRLALAVAQQLRAALQDRAGDVREPSESRVCRSDFVESDHQTVLSISDAVRVCPYKDADCGDRPANWCDTCPKRHAQQPAPVVPDGHPLMVFAKECELGAYMEHEVPLAARKAIAAAQQKGGSAG